MESIYASRTWQRWRPFVKWFASLVGTGAVTAFGFGFRTVYGWAESRASRTSVATEVAKRASIVGEVRRQAAHGSSLSDDNASQIVQLWQYEIAVQAELLVYRSYSRAAVDPARRAQLIEHAKNFYQLEWDAQLKLHANNPAEAARLTMLKEWPGR